MFLIGEWDKAPFPNPSPQWLRQTNFSNPPTPFGLATPLGLDPILNAALLVYVIGLGLAWCTSHHLSASPATGTRFDYYAQWFLGECFTTAYDFESGRPGSNPELIETVAEHGARLQPSINLHAPVTAFMFSCSSWYPMLAMYYPERMKAWVSPCAVIRAL